MLLLISEPSRCRWTRPCFRDTSPVRSPRYTRSLAGALHGVATLTSVHKVFFSAKSKSIAHEPTVTSVIDRVTIHELLLRHCLSSPIYPLRERLFTGVTTSTLLSGQSQPLGESRGPTSQQNRLDVMLIWPTIWGKPRICCESTTNSFWPFTVAVLFWRCCLHGQPLPACD